jgi:hypothetical protein
MQQFSVVMTGTAFGKFSALFVFFYGHTTNEIAMSWVI